MKHICEIGGAELGFMGQPTAWPVEGKWRCTAHCDYDPPPPPPPKKEPRSLKGFCQHCGAPIIMGRFSPKRNCFDCTKAIANLASKAFYLKKKDGIKRKVVYDGGWKIVRSEEHT